MVKERKILDRESKIIPGMVEEKIILEMEEEKITKECHNCGSTDIYMEDNEYVCRNCDLTWDK